MAMTVEFIQALPSLVAALLFVQACSVGLCSGPLSWLVMTAAPTGPARTLQCPCFSTHEDAKQRRYFVVKIFLLLFIFFAASILKQTQSRETEDIK